MASIEEITGIIIAMTKRTSIYKHISGSVPFKDSIAQRLFLVVFFFYLVISVIITAGQINETYSRTKNDISRELRVFGRAFDAGMSKALWEFDEDVLNSS
jgi:hypothetical protein